MKKIIYTLFLFVCVSLLFAGCQNVADTSYLQEDNAIRIMRKSHENGSIDLTYIFPANSKDMEKNFTAGQIETYKFYLLTYTNALARKNRLNAGVDMSVESSKYYADIDGFGFVLHFENLSVQKDFFGTSEDDNNGTNNQKISGFILKKIKLETQFPVSSVNFAEDLKAVCMLAISAWSQQCQIEETKTQIMYDKLKKTKFIYDFAVYGNGLLSDIMYYENGYSHNIFIKDENGIAKSNKIEFYLTEIDRGLVYIFVVIVVCLGMMISYLILKKKNKLKK